MVADSAIKGTMPILLCARVAEPSAMLFRIMATKKAGHGPALVNSSSVNSSSGESGN